MEILIYGLHENGFDFSGVTRKLKMNKLRELIKDKAKESAFFKAELASSGEIRSLGVRFISEDFPDQNSRVLISVVGGRKGAQTFAFAVQRIMKEFVDKNYPMEKKRKVDLVIQDQVIC